MVSPPRPTREGAHLHVRIAIKRKAVSSDTEHEENEEPTQMATVVPHVAFPDNETFAASDVDFASLFPGSLSSFSSVKRFSCTRCQLTRVPTALFELRMLSSLALRDNEINATPVQLEDTAITDLCVDLSGNQFTEVPEEVWVMPQLGKLDLTGNAVTKCETPDSRPEKVAATKLRELILDSNRVEVFNCQFPQLEVLSLRNTSLQTLPSILASHTKLRRLDLSQNPALSVHGVDRLLSVENLDLSANQLTTVPDSLPSTLTTVNLSHNNLSSVDALKSLTALANLTTISLEGNQLADATAVLSLFPSIANVSLAANGLTTCEPPGSFNALQFLNLSGNAITSFTLTSPQLQTLDLRKNKLSTPPTAVFSLSSLKELYLSGNPLEPWELSSTEYTFLSKLTTFAADQTAFASCSVGKQQDLHGFKVCVSATSATAPSPTPASSNPSSTGTANTRTSASNQILYLGGSFLIAALIALFVYTVLKRRRATGSPSEDDSAVSSRARVERESHESAQRIASGDGSSGYNNSGSTVKFVEDRSRSHSTNNGPSARNSHSNYSETSQSRGSKSVRGIGAMPATPPREMRVYSTDDELQSWRVRHEDVTMQKLLAVGTFVEVWQATYGADAVAVKKLKPRISQMYHNHPDMIEMGVLDDFVFEIRVLSRLNHPRIIAFYGVAWSSDADILAVTEYMPQQDLRGFLTRRRRSQSIASSGVSSSLESPWTPETVHMALCVAEALTWLHALEPPLVHGNVQARNVLLDDHMDSKLCDFGSAQYCHPSSMYSDPRTTSLSDTSRDSSTASWLPSARADATPWIAPEVLRGVALCDPSMDIYSFGVLLSEIDTTEVPYDGMHDERGQPLSDIDIRQRVAMEALRPTFLPSCPQSVLALAAQCLAFDPQDRPSSVEVVSALREIGIEMERASQVSQASQASSQAARSTVGALLSLPSSSSSVSDSGNSDMSQRTIEFRRFDTPEQLLSKQLSRN